MDNLLFSIFPNENFIDLSLYQFGWERCEPSHSFGPAVRQHYLFHYVISGSGLLMADDSKNVTHNFSIKSGQGFMIFPGQINTYIADNKLPWEYVWLEFDGLHAKQLITLVGLSPDAPVYHAKSHDFREIMKNEMLYIAQHNGQTPLHLMGHMYLFLDAFSRSVAPIQIVQGNTLQDFYIRESIVFVEQNFQNDITVADIADNCGLNRSYFGKIFHKALGQTPQQFLLNYRMTKAAELLRLTELSIGDIGKAVGYENQLHFSRAFKNIHGCSPREWRNAHPSPTIYSKSITD